MLKHYNLKLPDEVAVFSVPTEGIRRWDASALVYDVVVGTGSGFSTAYLRHYAFLDRWFEVNVSLDADGAFATEPAKLGSVQRSFAPGQGDVKAGMLEEDARSVAIG